MTILFLANPYSLYLFCFLTVLTRAFSPMMDIRGDIGHPFLVPHLQRDTCRVSPLSIIFATMCVHRTINSY